MSSNKSEDFKSSYAEESIGSKLIQTWETKPLGVLSFCAIFGCCSFAAWRYKTKGYAVSPSLFLINLRVGTQSLVIGIISLGMIYNIVQNNILKKKD